MKITGLLDSVSKIAGNKQEAKVLLKTFLNEGDKSGENSDYLASLDQSIKLLDQSKDLAEFRQKLPSLSR